MEITTKAVEIRDMTVSIYDRLNVIEAISDLLANDATNDNCPIEPNKRVTLLSFISITARECANDFDSLDMEDISDIEASRQI